MHMSVKRGLALTACIFAFGLHLAGLAAAQGGEVARQEAEAQKTSPDVRAGKLIGKSVKNRQGANLGEIQDLIVDLDAERVHYVILSFDKTIEPGEKLFAYPLSAFKQSVASDMLVLDVSPEKLRLAPGFERNHWPDLADKRYREEVDRYFQANTARGVASGERMTRASALIGRNVDDPEGRNAGEIEDVIVNLGSERIRYVVLDFDKAWSPDDKLVALPLSAFNFPSRSDTNAVLNVDRDRVNTARGFDEHAWPDLNSSAYRRDVDAYLSRFQAEQSARSGNDGAATSSGTSK